MRRLELDKTLYRGEAVDEAVKAYKRFGEFTLSETDRAWIVEVSCTKAARERSVAGELASHALGATIKSRRSAQ